jgi:hypothetical protein
VVLVEFRSVENQASGYSPYAGLVQGTDGAFYGTASSAGPQGGGVIFGLSADVPTVSKQALTTNED